MMPSGPWWTPRRLRGFSRKTGLWCPYGCREHDKLTKYEHGADAGMLWLVCLAILLILLYWIM